MNKEIEFMSSKKSWVSEERALQFYRTGQTQGSDVMSVILELLSIAEIILKLQEEKYVK